MPDIKLSVCRMAVGALNLTFLFLLFIFVSATESRASSLYSPYEGLEFGYRYLDTANYDMQRLRLAGVHSSGANIFSYDFEHAFGDETLTTIGASYGYKYGSHWFGLGLSSASDKPFSKFNVIDFDVYYAFRVFSSNLSGLYIGIDYSTERILLDGYPLPVIRYEYKKPGVNLIIGFPMTYINVAVGKFSSFELKYLPVMDLFVSYNLGFNKYNTLSFQFIMENERYKIADNSDVYFSNQVKYYTEMSFVRLKYSLTLADILTISPYAEMMVAGNRYYGKNINVRNKQKIDFGYALGANLSLKF